MITHKVFNKMEFQGFKKTNFSIILAELQRKLKFSAKSLKYHPTKREKAFENFNHISFFTLVAPKTQKMSFFISLARKKTKRRILHCSLLFSNMSGKSQFCVSKLRYFEKFRKNLKIEL